MGQDHYSESLYMLGSPAEAHMRLPAPHRTCGMSKPPAHLTVVQSRGLPSCILPSPIRTYCRSKISCESENHTPHVCPVLAVWKTRGYGSFASIQWTPGIYGDPFPDLHSYHFH